MYSALLEEITVKKYSEIREHQNCRVIPDLSRAGNDFTEPSVKALPHEPISCQVIAVHASTMFGPKRRQTAL